MPNLSLLRADNTEAVTDITMTERGSVRVCTVMDDYGREAPAVRATCCCGAVAFPTTQLPPRVRMDQLQFAAAMLLNDTMRRCRAGIDLAPGCIAARGGVRKVSAASRAGRLRGLSLTSP